MSKKWIFETPITYFIQGEITQRIKIWTTQTLVSERIRVMQTGSPDLLNFIGGCFGPEYEESFLHWKFREHNIHGEWFYNCGEIRNFIDTNCIKSEQALYHAYREIEQGKINYKGAIKIGTEQLEVMANNRLHQLSAPNKALKWDK